MVDGKAKTPRYVLKNGSQLIGPNLSRTTIAAEVSVIFGFSAKSKYDAFMKASSQALMPYPLIEGFMRNQLAGESVFIRLVVLDALSPQQKLLLAATYQDILESLRLHTDSVRPTYQLIQDESSQDYCVQAILSTEPKELSS